MGMPHGVQQHLKQAQRQTDAGRDAEHEGRDPVALELRLCPVLLDDGAHGVIQRRARHQRDEADDQILLRGRLFDAREDLGPDKRYIL